MIQYTPRIISKTAMFYAVITCNNYAQHDNVYNAVTSYNHMENNNVLSFIKKEEVIMQGNIYD